MQQRGKPVAKPGCDGDANQAADDFGDQVVQGHRARREKQLREFHRNRKSDAKRRRESKNQRRPIPAQF